MRDISGEEAAKLGITAHHQEMDNGEYRFRLRASDGSTYIRTESRSGAAWQNSHYHNNVRETYIVQRGWIAYATLLHGERKISIYRAGELFTTQPHIIHNVYMAANSVLHTVKHGEVVAEDRIEDETTRQFDKVTHSLAEDQIRLEAEKPSEAYSAEYRHFDTLIWQLPAWCTTIFTVTAIGTNSIEQANLLTQSTGLTKRAITMGFMILMSFVILVMSQALHRFRKHQASLRQYTRTPFWSSASTYLQMVVTLEAFALSFLVMLISGLPLRPALAGCIFLVLLLTFYREYDLRRGKGA
jgi:hypothetical protein